jgi:feruloyl esterase
MRRLFVLALLFATPALAQDLPVITANPSACDGLKGLRLPDVRFTEITDIRDSVQRSDNVRVPHCRVAGVIGKGVAFVVMLPNQWNQRLLMGGNGGFAGTISRGVFAASTQGYVTVSTNTGHEESPGGGARWALNDTERQLDYGYVAVHRTVEVAKVLSKNFYGSEPKFSYFTGCSNGGRQALMEAQRYPDDFDGILAGAPAAHFSRTGASFMKNLRATFPDPSYFDKPIVTQDNLDLVSAKVLEACDASDGVKDGVLDDPRDCKFKLSSIKACPGNRAAADCLTAAQRSAIAAIYAPTMDGSTVVYPGQPFGGESGGWPAWITGRDTGLMRALKVPNAQVMFATEGAKYFAFGDSTWDYSKYRGSFYRDSKRLADIADADNPDLSKFAARKGKLILWHGWADPALNPLGTIEYYSKVLERDPRATEYVRLFMAPGVLHCGGGEGPSTVSWLPAVVDWVEKSRAPEQVIASKSDANRKVTRTRPLCAYPKRAVYSGQGSTDDAANFSCRAP